MIKIFTKIKIAGIILILISFLSCKKDKQVSQPVVSTTPASNVLYITATSGGNVIKDGGTEVTLRGVCWSTNHEPTTENSKTGDGSGTGEFSSSVKGLSLGTLYYLRAYATNSEGTVYGDEISFTTHVTGINFNPGVTYGSVTDIEGTIYKTVRLGTLEWMAENLRTKEYNDGTAIPLVTDDAEWSNLQSPAYSWFDNNDTLYGKFYGAHYNWFAVNAGKLCPPGWHIPTDNEWQLFIDFLGGNNGAGSKIKETGTNNWTTSNRFSTNESGFTALPAGLRGSLDGVFGGQGVMGGWWTGTELDPSPLGAAWVRWIHADTSVIVRTESFKKSGFSVRCVKY
jgi:uncharacterized protein (TIGR02145 family)